MAGETTERTVLEISGEDRRKFLQDLVTNDVSDLSKLTYAALLSAQGKYLFDFFLFEKGASIFLDVQSDQVDALIMRLNMYKLRANVTVSKSDLECWRGIGDPPEGAFSDPRDRSMGWRAYGITPDRIEDVDWTALRVAACIPQTGKELLVGDTYILEAGFERLNGVDFQKGCYVGQEITARMKHKTELRKGLARVSLDSDAATGSQITRDGRPVGTVHSVAGRKAIAYLRFDRVGEGMKAGYAEVSLDGE